MKKRLTALAAGVLSIAMLCSVSALAVEKDARVIYSSFSSKTNSVTPAGVTFSTHVDANYTTSGSIKGNAVVWVDASATVPGGTMSARAFVLSADKSLLRDKGFILEPYDANFTWVQTADTSLSSSEATFFGGQVKLYLPGYSEPVCPSVNAVKYDGGRCSSVSPVTPQRAGSSVNSRGMTYGTLLDEKTPDLIAAVGVDGNAGYVLHCDFDPTFYTAAAQARYQERLKENNLIPLYDVELNQIGWYALDTLTREEGPDPLTQARINEQAARKLPAVDWTPAVRAQDALYEETCSEGLVDGDFLRNAKGETFGTVFNRYAAGYDPDWIASVGDNGVPGYMSFLDFTYSKCGDTVDLRDMEGNVVDQFTFSTASDESLEPVKTMEEQLNELRAYIADLEWAGARMDEYPSELGTLAVYRTPDPHTGAQYNAILYRNDGTSIALKSLLPSCWQHYFNPRDIQFSEDGTQLTFISPIEVPLDSIELKELRDTLCTLDLTTGEILSTEPLNP